MYLSQVFYFKPIFIFMDVIRKIIREELTKLGSTLKLVPSYMDKHTSIQLTTDNPEVYNHMKKLFYPLKKAFPELNFFKQGDIEPRWLMFEAWSKDEDKIFEAAEWLSEELKIDLSI